MCCSEAEPLTRLTDNDHPVGPTPQSWQAAPKAALILHVFTLLNPSTQPSSAHFPQLSSIALKKINEKLPF